MDIPAQMRFYTNKYSWLCFRHAVLLTMQGMGDGGEVEVEVGIYDEHWMGSLNVCDLCAAEDDLR